MSRSSAIQKSFEIPTELALRIAAYIERPRKLIVQKTRSKNAEIILNLITGESLSRQAVSGISSNARRALRWPLGGGLHSWRRTFTTELIEREMDSRIELGLDLSLESLSMTVAAALGHESLDSHRAYVRDTQRRTKKTDAAEHSRMIISLHEKIAKLSCELARNKNANV